MSDCTVGRTMCPTKDYTRETGVGPVSFTMQDRQLKTIYRYLAQLLEEDLACQKQSWTEEACGTAKKVVVWCDEL